MKKLLAILFVLTLALSLCACAAEPNEPTGTQPKGTEAPAPTEPEVTEEPPIEISEFCPVDDMPAPFSDEDPVAFSDETYAITVGGESYTPEWLYNHNIYDWRTAGITFDQVNAVADGVLDMPFNSDALAEFKAKISEFTMIMMLEAPADINTLGYAVTLDDEVYDIAWLSSHNATEYKEAGIPAATIKEFLDILHDDFWYTREYRWMEEVYARLTK